MKLTKHAWILWGLALIVFGALAFLIPFHRTSVFWVGFGATVAMFGVVAWAFYRAFRRDAKIESKLLGWPIFKVACIALAVQLVAGFALMATAEFCPMRVAVLAEIILFAAAFACLTAKDAAREAVTVNETQLPDVTAGWKVIRGKAAALAAARPLPEMKKLADDIRYSDPTSCPSDERILEILTEMESAEDSDFAALTAKAVRLVSARKAEIKAGK